MSFFLNEEISTDNIIKHHKVMLQNLQQVSVVAHVMSILARLRPEDLAGEETDTYVSGGIFI